MTHRGKTKEKAKDSQNNKAECFYLQKHVNYVYASIVTKRIVRGNFGRVILKTTTSGSIINLCFFGTRGKHRKGVSWLLQQIKSLP